MSPIPAMTIPSSIGLGQLRLSVIRLTRLRDRRAGSMARAFATPRGILVWGYEGLRKSNER